MSGVAVSAAASVAAVADHRPGRAAAARGWVSDSSALLMRVSGLGRAHGTTVLCVHTYENASCVHLLYSKDRVRDDIRGLN